MDEHAAELDSLNTAEFFRYSGWCTKVNGSAQEVRAQEGQMEGGVFGSYVAMHGYRVTSWLRYSG